MGEKNVCLPYLTRAEEFANHRKLFQQPQAYATFIWDRLRKEYMPTLNNWQKRQSMVNKNLKEGDFVWWIKESDKRGYYALCSFTETIGGPDDVFDQQKFKITTGFKRNSRTAHSRSKAHSRTTRKQSCRDRKRDQQCFYVLIYHTH